MEPVPDCLSSLSVITRLQEIVGALKHDVDISVQESELRELQHFFNERSAEFLQAARTELKRYRSLKHKIK